MNSFFNLFAVKFYGGKSSLNFHFLPSNGLPESEFWLALGKALLAIGLIFFTFITMVGGNPQKDAYGFRFWNRKSIFHDSHTYT